MGIEILGDFLGFCKPIGILLCFKSLTQTFDNDIIKSASQYIIYFIIIIILFIYSALTLG